MFEAGLPWKVSRLALDQAYDIPGYESDNEGRRCLRQWSQIQPDRIYLTEHFDQQLAAPDFGLFSCDLRTGTVDTVATISAIVLALSPDERQMAITPNDESCCGAITAPNRSRAIVPVWAMTPGSAIVAAMYATPPNTCSAPTTAPIRSMLSTPF